MVKGCVICVCVVVGGGVLIVQVILVRRMVLLLLLLLMSDSRKGVGRRDGNGVGTCRWVSTCRGRSRVNKVILKACTTMTGWCGFTIRKCEFVRLLFFRWSTKAPAMEKSEKKEKKRKIDNKFLSVVFSIKFFVIFCGKERWTQNHLGAHKKGLVFWTDKCSCKKGKGELTKLFEKMFLSWVLSSQRNCA